jgi:hypothetical protein
MNLILVCTGLFLVIVGVAWPILLVMSYSSESELEAKLETLNTEKASLGWKFLLHIHSHRISVAWTGLVLVILGLLV